MKVLVTGSDGFVGAHLVSALRSAGHEVIGAPGPDDPKGLDVTDAARVTALFGDVRPDAIVHLAAVSSVARSHRDPSLTFRVNALGTLHVLAAARATTPTARLLVVGSGEVYGRHDGGAPLSEDAALRPLSPYAASKEAAEVAALQFHRSYGTDVICVRSFSHLGRGQTTDFVVPSLAAQIAAIRRGAAPRTLRTGDLSPVRDFLHVDDVVNAYAVLLRSGVPGAVYNVASGAGRTVQSLLDEMLELSGVTAGVEKDPERVRPVEIPALVGDASRLRALGWKPERTVREALGEVLEEHGGS